MPEQKEPITLLIPEKTDAEFEQVFGTWIQRGGLIKRLGKYWIKDEALARQPLAVYGNQTFALVLEQIYDLQLVMPDDTLIARLEQRWTKRVIRHMAIDTLREDDFPAFIKPVIPKLFTAAVFDEKADFDSAVQGLLLTEEILLAEIIPDIQAEARSFVLSGNIKDLAFYEGDADLEEGGAFLAAFIKQYKDSLPETVVVDIAYAPSVGWFVLEFNACWGAGLNNCRPEKVIDCIIAATKS
jgi:hypothetical protein